MKCTAKPKTRRGKCKQCLTDLEQCSMQEFSASHSHSSKCCPVRARQPGHHLWPIISIHPQHLQSSEQRCWRALLCLFHLVTVYGYIVHRCAALMGYIDRVLRRVTVNVLPHHGLYLAFLLPGGGRGRKNPCLCWG